jgi:Domain of Unknown Function (DUF1080)
MKDYSNSLWLNRSFRYLLLSILLCFMLRSAVSAEPPSRRIFGEGGVIRRFRDDLQSQLQAPPPNTTGKPAANGTAAKRNAEPAAKPTFREPQPSKTVSAAPAKPAVPNVAKAPPKNVLPAVTRSVPSVSPPAVTTPAPKSTTQVAKSTPPVPATIPLKEVTTKPYDQAVVSVLVSDKKKLTSTWKPLFNGKDLTHWESSKFGGDGEVSVENGMIVLTEGGDMTGITYKGEVPTMNYALEVEAQRLDGVDFFAGVTFPVGETHMTLIPGGWAGGVFGLSSINGMEPRNHARSKISNGTSSPFK